MAPDKITSKNLSYDQTLPPFLARLHGQHPPGGGDGPDPILAGRRRPGTRVRTASEEAEDAPLVVDEHGNVVQLDGDAAAKIDDESDGRDGRDAGAEKTAAATPGGHEAEAAKAAAEPEKVAGIGAAKKRKVGRIVGGGSDDDNDVDGKGGKKRKEEADVDADIARAVRTIKNIAGEDSGAKPAGPVKPSSGSKADGDGDKKKSVKKGKAKKIKLMSFGDEEG
ncbi:hypothetical protein BX600DRAFT_471745 [Xylariales sp. PMI_506]|nr:hypothetical protein BX600DRAFT_471745 [Xylariales sp. PMI_506]